MHGLDGVEGPDSTAVQRHTFQKGLRLFAQDIAGISFRRARRASCTEPAWDVGHPRFGVVLGFLREWVAFSGHSLKDFKEDGFTESTKEVTEK